jgi:hypothetical protein
MEAAADEAAPLVLVEELPQAASPTTAAVPPASSAPAGVSRPARLPEPT